MEPEDHTHLWQSYRSGEDPTAFNRLFDILHAPLLRRLRNKFPTVPDEDREDAAADAFVFLVTNPEAFDPVRSALLGFLALIAHRNLTDQWRKKQRRPTVSLADTVGEGSASAAEPRTGRTMVEDEAFARIAYGDADPADTLRLPVQAWLEALLPDTRDQNLFLMTAEDRLTVEEFAHLYDVQSLPLSEQRREMKRCRDRVQKRVERDGTKLWQLVYGEEPLPPRWRALKGGADKTP